MIEMKYLQHQLRLFGQNDECKRAQTLGTNELVFSYTVE